MTAATTQNWQSIQEAVRQKIQDRTWKPGDLIPNEADLAKEFGCARATVNRALRQLAETGLLDRKRKAGTRVTMHPVRKATLHIPIFRKEIEERNQHYDYALISSRKAIPPGDVRGRMRLDSVKKIMKVEALHLADGKPFLFEDRWLNSSAIRGIEKVNFSKISANEWLVMNAPFTRGDIAFSAINATEKIAETLNVLENTALFVIDRTTWEDEIALTDARMIYADGYRMRTVI